MRRILLLTIALLAALFIGGYHEWTPARASVTPHTASCSNSFPADGHAGPWHTMVSGGQGTLHGNTVHVSCPSPDTHWSIDYSVQVISNGNGIDVFSTHHQGNGTPFDFSDSVTPFPCSDPRHVLPFRTHVTNLITGGSMNKPSGGTGVHICGV